MQALAEYWNDRASTYDNDHGSENEAAWARELSRLIGENRSISVLDAGAGTGFLSIKLAALGCRVTASDIAEKMLEKAKQKAESCGLRICCTTQTGDVLPFDSDCFDLVISSRVLGLVEKPMETLDDWVRVLRPGGKMIAMVRLMQKPKSESDRSKAPLCYAAPEDFETALIKAGLLEVHTEVLPEDMMLDDPRRWYVFVGRKPETTAEKKQAIGNR